MNQGVGDTTAFINAFYQRGRDCAMQECNSSRANSSKLKFYNKVKTELGLELYLTHINVKKLRAAMSRFRCLNHILKIEMGRYDGTNEENRYCPLCTKKGLFLIENEFHLIVECEYYATLSNTYLESEYLNYIRFIELFTSTDKSILFNANQIRIIWTRAHLDVLEHPPVRFGRIWCSSFGEGGLCGQPDTHIHTYIQTDRQTCDSDDYSPA